MEGEATYDWFGSAMACHTRKSGGSLLVVSAPGAADPATRQSGRGRVYGFLFTAAVAGASPGAPPLTARRVFRLSGSRKFDHLGVGLALGNPYGGDHSLYLAVSMPTRPVYYCTLGSSASASPAELRGRMAHCVWDPRLVLGDDAGGRGGAA
jgi:hypothetical protein